PESHPGRQAPPGVLADAGRSGRERDADHEPGVGEPRATGRHLARRGDGDIERLRGAQAAAWPAAWASALITTSHLGCRARLRQPVRSPNEHQDPFDIKDFDRSIASVLTASHPFSTL